MKKVVQLGSHVFLEVNGVPHDFAIIDGTNPDGYHHAAITLESQVGRELLGRAKGDEFELVLEGEVMRYRILEVR